MAQNVGAPTGPRPANRLASETSPYLRQHAHNPVDWYPWGDEAFDVARRTGRPVFLSVGYSTCHWCHVMAEESFEDPEIAAVLNERFVAIKVDREERPDIDAVYMAATQALTGGGGWPMSVWLDHERRPFLAGTYFPPRDGERGALRGFLSVLRDVAEAWEKTPGRVESVAVRLADAVRVALGTVAEGTGRPPGVEALEAAFHASADAFDARHGGLVGAPKFPSSFPVRALLRYHRRSRDPKALAMAVRTLEAMAAGGIHDQLAGGFHRYSTDERWLVPHFEKMLYDNALLAVAYAEAWQVTRRPDFARVVRTTLDYLLRDLEAPDGGFCSATDADSEGEEGRYFIWTAEEIRRALGADAPRFEAFYGVTEEGNSQDESVLHVPRPDEAEWEALAGARARLLEVRARRPAPRRDEKRIAGWNGLAISALAFGGRVLAEPRWIEAAERAARFVLGDLRRGGRLLRSFTAGRASPVHGFLSDHAFVTQGLLDLYEATFEPRWLEAARAIADATEEHFADRDAGGWFVTASDGEPLIAREKPTRDGAEPSGASVAALNALRLAAFTVDARWRRIADGALRAQSHTLENLPTALGEMLLAVDFATDAVREVVLVWPEGEPAPEPFLKVLRETFLPSRALAGAAEGPALEVLGGLALFAREKRAAGRPTAYVCEQGICRLPAIDPEKLRSQIEPVRPLR
ncbi:MAG TPA: thioredoxin domain-containing protein [Anaeromyxobacteraceae bacterium]|nr:thioredoxin domain-containing protein [Anaeromyxobacteraceae bacterium]